MRWEWNFIVTVEKVKKVFCVHKKLEKKRPCVMQASHLLTDDITSCTCWLLASPIGREGAFEPKYERMYREKKIFII